MAFIRPERFPALTQIDAFEWTSDIRSMGNVATAVGFFRDFFVFMNSTSAGFTTHAVASFSANATQDSIPTAANGFRRGTAIGLSGQFDLFSSHVLVDGLALLDSSGRYVRYWQNIDGLGGTGSQCVNTNEIQSLASSTLCLATPKQVTFRLERISRVVSPNEHLAKDALTGDWRALGAGTDGNGYDVWRARILEGTRWSDLALFYEPVSEPLNLSQPYSIAPEAPSNFPGSPTYADSPARVDYTGVRVWDGSRWVDFTDFFVYAESMSAVDNNHGYSVRDAFGKITSHIGVSGLKTNKYVLGPGLTFQSTSGVTLTSIGTQTYGSFTGDVFQLGASTYPYIQHEEDRGVWLLHPEVGTGAQLTFAADYKGTWTFTGDFTPAINAGAGDGVVVTALSQTGATLAGSSIAAGATVDDTSYTTLFAGASTFHFSFTKALEVGETVRFRVTAGATKTDDLTAFRLTERSFVKSGTLRSFAVKGEPMYVPPGYLRQTLPNEAGRPGRLVSAHGIRHEVFFFDDADDLESWRTCPEGAIALAVAQSESDSASDVNAIIDQENRIRFHSASGNRKCWLHVWRRASRKASATGVDVPPASQATQGAVPRGTGQWSADATLAANNLANGRAIGFHGHRHRVYGLERVVNGDTVRVHPGTTSLAFQPLYGQLRHVRARLTERTARYATVTFDVTGDEVDGDLHVWSR